ncbi:MAG: peroxide stress protein YaaA [Acidobacteria bacterium]|nr:peroxide stress protein YaaA [Acidobacteriota bacterium]
MLIVISPAKSLDLETKIRTRKHSQPVLLNHSRELVDVMAAKSPDELAEMMSISADLANTNVDRFADFTTPFTTNNSRPAVLTFNGDVYMGMDAATFTERDLTRAQKTLRILSGLYGVLRPLDLIQPYRLEMGTTVANPGGANLYEFWGDTITDTIAADLKESPGSPALINLASIEYFRSVRSDKIDARIINPRFLDSSTGNDPKVISFFAKRARGAMAGWMIRNRVNSVKALREFDDLGYRYDPDRSNASQPVFTRHNATMKAKHDGSST